MPSNTAGGWPYPLATEATRDGATAIQNLATENERRLAGQMVIGVYAVANFDGNGLWYAPDWRTQYNCYWTSAPAVTVICGTTTTGGDSGVVAHVYMPHNSAQQLVLGANYVKDGRVYTGLIDLFIVAAGTGRRG